MYIYSVEYELGLSGVWGAFGGFQRLRSNILIEYILRILLVYSVLYSSLEKRRGFFDIDVTMCNDIYQIYIGNLYIHYIFTFILMYITVHIGVILP